MSFVLSWRLLHFNDYFVEVVFVVEVFFVAVSTKVVKYSRPLDICGIRFNIASFACICSLISVTDNTVVLSIFHIVTYIQKSFASTKFIKYPRYMRSFDLIFSIHVIGNLLFLLVYVFLCLDIFGLLYSNKYLKKVTVHGPYLSHIMRVPKQN